VINITQQQALEIEHLILNYVFDHFDGSLDYTTTWTTIDKKKTPTLQYNPPTVADLYADCGFTSKRLPSSIFEQVRKSLVRSGQIQICNERLTTRDGKFFVWKAPNLAQSWVYLDPRGLDLKGITATRFPKTADGLVGKEPVGDVNDETFYGHDLNPMWVSVGILYTTSVSEHPELAGGAQ
jgi:hypothetical protein